MDLISKKSMQPPRSISQMDNLPLTTTAGRSEFGGSDLRSLNRLTVPGRRSILLTTKARKRQGNARRSIQVGGPIDKSLREVGFPDGRMRFKDRLTLQQCIYKQDGDVIMPQFRTLQRS